MTPLPCPFCGHVGVNVHEASSFRWLVAECNNCGAQCGEVRRDTMKPSTEEENQINAIAEWNIRAKPQPVELCPACASAEFERVSGFGGLTP